MRPFTKWCAPRLAFLLAAVAPVIPAQTSFGEDQRFVPSLGSVGSFGQSVALDGETALIAASGKAFFFREVAPGAWTETQVLSPTGSDQCSFGSLVHLDEGRAGVTDLLYPGVFCDRVGQLYAYDDSGVSLPLTEKISGYTLATGISFGFTVDLAMDGDWLLAGADGYSPDLNDLFPKAVFLQREEDHWNELQKVSGSDTVLYSGFGQAVAIDATSATAVIGDPELEAVYVFQYDGTSWSEIQRLTASDGSPADGFGSAVAIENGVIAVASPLDDAQFVNQGSVYVYRFDGSSWQETQNFTSFTLTANAKFGNSLELEDGRLAAGAPGDNVAFVFRDFGSSFLLVQQLAASTPTGLDKFGTALTLDGPRCLVGASSYGTQGSKRGAAFLYELHDLALTTSSAQVQAGQTLTIVTRGGLPGTPCQVTFGLGRRAGSGLTAPQFGIPGAIQGVFNAEGRCVQNLAVPAGLVGKTLKLRTHGQVSPGVVEESNPIAVAVL